MFSFSRHKTDIYNTTEYHSNGLENLCRVKSGPLGQQQKKMRPSVPRLRVAVKRHFPTLTAFSRSPTSYTNSAVRVYENVERRKVRLWCLSQFPGLKHSTSKLLFASLFFLLLPRGLFLSVSDVRNNNARGKAGVYLFGCALQIFLPRFQI
jgi:hypothetical protein